MKIIFKKVAVIVLIIAFFINPIAQIILGLGNVQAAERYYIINDGDPISINSLISKDEKAIIVETKNKYKVRYRVAFILDVFEGDENAFYIGRMFQTSDSRLTVRITQFDRLSDLGKDWVSRNGTSFREKKYSHKIVLEGYLNTDYKLEPTFPTISVSYSGNHISFNQQLVQKEYSVITSQKKYKVISNQSSTVTNNNSNTAKSDNRFKWNK